MCNIKPDNHFKVVNVNDHFPGAASRARHRAETDITIRENGELNRRKPKGRNRKETPKPKPKHCDASKMVEGSNESTGAADKRTPSGETITWITVVHSLVSVGCSQQGAHQCERRKATKGKVFFFLSRV